MRLLKRLGFPLIILYTLVYYGWIYHWQQDSWLLTLGGDIICLIGVITATLFTIVTTLRSKDTQKVFWSLLSLANLCYLISEIIWDYYELFLKVDVPFPGWVDIFCYMQVILFIAAITYSYKKRHAFQVAKFIFDTVIIMSVVTTLIWHYIVGPLFSQSQSTLYIIASVGYPIGDLGLLFGAISLFMSSTYMFPKRVAIFMSVGFVIQAIGDLCYAYTLLTSSYVSSGSYFDPLWTLSILIIAFSGFIYAIEDQETINSEDTLGYQKTDKIRLVLPYFSLVFLLTIILGSNEKIDILLIGFAITIFLTAIRQVFTLLENITLIRRFHDLNTDLENKVTERTKELSVMNTKLIQASEFKDDIITSMSHELRTPMHAILSYIQLIEDGDDGPVNQEILADLGVIKRSTMRLLCLIDNLMKLSKIHSGKDNLELQEISLVEIVNQTYEELRHLAREKGVELIVEPDTKDVTITSDLMKIQQILINLVMNSIKFTTKGYVKISTKINEKQFEICVEDTGAGIAKEYHNYIFDRFTQIDHGVRRKYGGVGIGLAIVKELVMLLQGNILLESEPGHGSKFTLTFPRRLLQGSNI
ncbi:DUF4084 domain-containing protein [Desulfosporosinus sp. Sb-LF]|uniref:DUF4084 domain-containing protein n=1 Tax=Desulfosporosinus sp. Sb-LF TaxID=2560027 RepID=UPI00107F6E2A|nr:DUF4084 domain-containing protein [Desulfosporosinus sp. Sb-LF]TGE33226.1 DUF4084 domain-containing protein [Desulfosporosinus sp. Sb-LF]